LRRARPPKVKILLERRIEMIKRTEKGAYKVIGVDPVIDKITFSSVLLDGLYAVPYYKIYEQEPGDKAIAKIVLIDLVKRRGITQIAKELEVDYTTVWRNYYKSGAKIGVRLANEILKTDPTIKLARVALQACRNEHLIREWGGCDD
jgi:hypothetical protein